MVVNPRGCPSSIDGYSPFFTIVLSLRTVGLAFWKVVRPQLRFWAIWEIGFKALWNLFLHIYVLCCLGSFNDAFSLNLSTCSCTLNLFIVITEMSNINTIKIFNRLHIWLVSARPYLFAWVNILIINNNNNLNW